MNTLLRALLRFHLRRPVSLWVVVGLLTVALGLGARLVQRQLDLLSVLPVDHPAVRANLEAGVGQQEILWLVVEGTEGNLEVRRAWAENLVERLLDHSGMPLNGLAAEGRLAEPVARPGEPGLSPWPALLAVGALPDGDAAVGRATTETLYALAPAWLGDRLEPLNDPGEVQRRLAATAKALGSPNPVEATLARLDPLGLRSLAPQGAEGMEKALQLARSFTLRLRTGYLESKDGRMILVPVVASFPTSDTASTLRSLRWLGEGAPPELPARSSLHEVEQSLAWRTDRPFPVQVTGAHAITVFESQRLTHEVLLSLGLSFILVGLVYWIGFRTLSGYGFVMAPLLVGMVWALGSTGWALGRLNLMAAGFGAVLLGVGDDVGILLFSRYVEERHRGSDKVRALRGMLLGTGPGVVAGALTVVAAFASLAFTPFPGLRDLGITTGLGLLCCLVATFLILPALLLWLDRGHGPFARAEAKIVKVRKAPWKPKVALAVLAIALLLLPRVKWEEDLRRFRASGNPALALQEKLAKVLGASLQPLALQLTLDHPDQLPVRWNRIAPLLRAEGLPIPDWQQPSPELRLALASDTWRRSVLDAAAKAGLDPAGLERPLQSLGLAASDPAQPVLALQSLLPKADVPEPPTGTFLAPKLPAAAPSVLNLPLRLDEAAQDRVGPKVEEAGGRLVGTRPLFRAVKAIAWKSVQSAVLLTLGGILIVVALFGRSLRFALLALLPLLASQAGALGILGATGEPLTFLSLMAVPIALGVSVDTAFNLLHRARQERDAAAKVARVNAVCAGTTLAGFGGLVFSGYRGLRGLGLACLGGVALALLLTQWLLPAILERWPLKTKIPSKP
ncbi:MAG TPA: MMPL family transporter [Holophagaceae bacterium]|nr:MMPL family transporter [Holophagaceae bacterium]